MAQGCLKCLKYTMCVTNFLCFLSGVALLGFGVFMMVNFKVAALFPDLPIFNLNNILLTTGIIITCVSFLGFLGALKENRCLLLMFFVLLFLMMLAELTAACLLLIYDNKVDATVKDNLSASLEKAKGQSSNSTEVINTWNWVQTNLQCCGIMNATDWGERVPSSCRRPTEPTTYWPQGCLIRVRNWCEEHFLFIGISVIVLCIIEMKRTCAPCALKGTLVVSSLESQEKRVDWWRASVRAQDLQN
uniref:Tetraspanin n=1 Tax=Monopterus albus TaxID=43700 RepID=A0A3Q3IF52_MONAL